MDQADEVVADQAISPKATAGQKEDPASASLRTTLAQLLRRQRQLMVQFEAAKADYDSAVNERIAAERLASTESAEKARLVAMEEAEIARQEERVSALKAENKDLRTQLRRISAI